MADGDASESTADTTRNDGVLANLPRTRPQRSSARRTAARESASTNGRPSSPAKPRAKRSGPATAAHAGKPPRAQRTTAKAKSAKGATQTETKRTTPAAGVRPKSAKDSAATAQAKSSPGRSSAVRARRAQTGKRPPVPRRAVAVEEPAPRQGFECEGERATGPVQPPGGAELVATAAELVGELAKAGVSAGERLLKDVFSRLPGG